MALSNNTDEEVFELMKAGHRYALNELFERYYLRICRFVFQLINNKELAEEISSDTFFELWTKRNNIHLKTTVKAYAFAVARYKSYRSFGESRLVNFDFQDELEEIIEVNNPESDLIFDELEQYYNAVVEQLPNQCRIIYKLHKIDGLKYKEIAEALGITSKTVENHMGRALKLIRESLSHFQNN